jgi:hypothetical protein
MGHRACGERREELLFLPYQVFLRISITTNKFLALKPGRQGTIFPSAQTRNRLGLSASVCIRLLEAMGDRCRSSLPNRYTLVKQHRGQQVSPTSR